MKNPTIIPLLLLASVITSSHAYEHSVEIKPTDSHQAIIEKAAKVVPNKAQLSSFQQAHRPTSGRCGEGR